MRPTFGFCALAALLLAAPLRAEENCNKVYVQTDINLCMQHNYEEADAALNEAWKALPDETRARLREEERHWITARDIACKREAAQNVGGGIYPTVFYGCLAERTQARTKELRALAP
ncbi:MAG: DUF1311 domain-containing protein [Alphaproteobacteria bacterium]|nr:DUF1311 domain-containing protein [Alphaproteobacteria bacterium]MBV9694527.1 DUF1311 domain-containing protein [Alphaproteobacteria bacterium]